MPGTAVAVGVLAAWATASKSATGPKQKISIMGRLKSQATYARNLLNSSKLLDYGSAQIGIINGKAYDSRQKMLYIGDGQIMVLTSLFFRACLVRRQPLPSSSPSHFLETVASATLFIFEYAITFSDEGLRARSLPSPALRMVIIVASEVILAVRTWAIWDKRKSISDFLCVIDISVAALVVCSPAYSWSSRYAYVTLALAHISADSFEDWRKQPAR
ncbi:hypothetical protein C8R43DRAFT_950402 [Mycena crocata]|nr:hypothetical protein C8R43DRAFT_950402 [Mycena crocata]